jgi:hypothetical protein
VSVSVGYTGGFRRGYECGCGVSVSVGVGTQIRRFVCIQLPVLLMPRAKVTRRCHSAKVTRRCHSAKVTRRCHSAKVTRRCHSAKVTRRCFCPVS